MTKRAFGDLENQIVSVLKTRKRATVKDVLEALSDQDKYTTVMTVMNRLVDKKLVGREKVGLRFEYWLMSEVENSKSIFDRIRHRLFGMKTVDFVSCLISEATDLSNEDLEEMERLIAKAKKRSIDE